MTDIFGNTGGGGGSLGHRVLFSYSVVGQSVAGNYTDLYWAYGIDYADPDWWNNISNRSVSLGVATGSGISGISGFGTGTSSSPFINTSDPGYGGQIHYFWDGTVRLFHNSSGQGAVSVAASCNFSTNAYTSSISTNIGFSDIVQAPTAPTSLTSTRISDTQINLGWTNTSSSHHEYANVKVFRSTDGGGAALIATLGVVTSYNDTGVSANHKYTYYVQSSNAAGTADSSTTSALWTTPGTPTGLTATKLSGGNIQLDWTNATNYSEYTVRIEESQNGGAYSELTSVSTGITTYTHVSPSTSVTHKYRIRARTSSGTTLNSSYSNETDTIVLLSTAGAPTGLAPSGPYLDAAEDIVFTWTHNPTDATPQTKYQLQYAVDGGGYTTVGPTTSGVSSYTLPAATLTNGHTITWRVATAGQNGTVGSYSSIGTFFTQARPTSTISSPSGGGYLNSVLTVNWTYFQAQSSAQATWHAYLWHKGALSDYSDATLIGEASGSGTTATYTFNGVQVLDGETYGVRVYVTSATGLTSSDLGTEREEFTVTYLPPADADLTVTYDAGAGRVTVDIVGTSASPGVTEAISTVDIQRSIDGGDWVTWVTGIVLEVGTLEASLVDVAPTIHGNNNYRLIIHSAVPSTAFSDEADVDTAETQWCFLSSFEGGFADALKMRARVSTRATVGRTKAVYAFAGRERPVELAGEDTRLGLAVLATLYGTSSGPADMEAIGETTGIVLWRDFTGRRLYASLGDVNVDYVTQQIIYPVAFNLMRVDYDENVG